MRVEKLHLDRAIMASSAHERQFIAKDVCRDYEFLNQYPIGPRSGRTEIEVWALTILKMSDQESDGDHEDFFAVWRSDCELEDSK